MIHFEGVETFPDSPESLFAKLSDAGFLAHCLPEAEVSEATPDRAAWKVKPKLAFISGTIDTTASVIERIAGKQVRYRLDTKSVGAGSVVEATLDFATPDTGGTTVSWRGDITTLSGLMKLAPKGLIQATAQKVIADVWVAIHARVAA